MAERELITQVELARRLGRSTRIVRRFTRDGVLVRENGLYPWPASRERWLRHVKEDHHRRRSPRAKLKETVVDLDAVRLRKAQIALERAELELAEHRARLIPLEVHEARVRAIVERVNASLKAIRGRWGPHMLGIETVQEFQLRVAPLINELLEELSAMEPPTAAEVDRMAGG
jgi:hypothetical protein